MRIILAFLFSATATFAQADKLSTAIASLETGVVCAQDPVSLGQAPGTVAGTINIIEDSPPFVSTGNRVPAVLGVGFGGKALSQSLDGISDVTMTVSHPPMGKDKITSQTYQTSISGNDPSLAFYQFDFDYELLIGTWRLQASKDGKVLYLATFDVVAPQDIPELAQVCGFMDMLS